MADNRMQKILRHNIIFSALCIIFLLGAIAFYFVYIQPYTQFSDIHHDEAINNISTTNNIKGLRELAISSYITNEKTVDTLISAIYLMALLCTAGLLLSLANINFLRNHKDDSEDSL